jgi:hypothetical protein
LALHRVWLMGFHVRLHHVVRGDIALWRRISANRADVRTDKRDMSLQFGAMANFAPRRDRR